MTDNSTSTRSAAVPGAGPLVSLVVPAYNEAENVAGLVQLASAIAVANPGHRFELVVVDDGSVDGTPEFLRTALEVGPVNARIVSLSRNFGSHAAITAGFRAARGACAITLSADLQEPLEVIGRLLTTWEAGNDVVWGVRATRSVPTGLANALSRGFSRWFHRWSTIPTYPAEGPSIVLVSRAVLDVVNAMQEANRNIFGLVAWSGFNQATVAFEQLPRPAGRSKWTNAKKIKLVVDSCVEFSQTPARVAGYLGAALCLIATLLAVVGVVLAATPATGAGFWFVGALALLVGGLNLGFLSVMGEYVWRAGDDARRRPIYVTRSIHDVVARRPREDGEAVAPSEDDVVAPTRVAAEAAQTWPTGSRRRTAPTADRSGATRLLGSAGQPGPVPAGDDLQAGGDAGAQLLQVADDTDRPAAAAQLVEHVHDRVEGQRVERAEPLVDEQRVHLAPVRGVCIREAEEGGADTVLIETVGMHGDPSNFDLPAVPAFSSLRRKVEPKPGPDGERYALLQLSGYGLRSSRTVLDVSGTGAWAPQPRPVHHYSPVSGGA